MGVFSLDMPMQFKYLSVENIVSFLKEEIRDPLHKITINIKSKENAVDDPLNQNIYFSSIDSNMSSIFSKAINSSVTVLDISQSLEDHPNYYDIERAILETLRKEIQTSLLFREKILRDMQIERENSSLDFYKPLVLDTINKTFMTNGLASDLPASIQKDVITGIQNNELKDVLSYRIVKDEIITAIKKSDIDDIPYQVLNAIVPYLQEGIHKFDSSILSSSDKTIAERALIASLTPVLTSSMTEAIMYAKKVNYTFFHEFERESWKIEDDVLILMRQFIPVLFLNDPTLLSLSEKNFSINDFLTKFAVYYDERTPRILLAKVFTAYFSKKIEELGEKPPKYYRPYMLDIFAKYNTPLFYRTQTKFVLEYRSYKNTNRLFSKENATSMAKFAKHLLESRVAQLQVSDLQYEHDKKLQKSFESLSPELRSFLNMMENEAIKSYGFTKGMFRFSKAYFDTFQVMFSSLINPFSNGLKNESIKDEL